MSGEDNNFLARWARRKVRVAEVEAKEKKLPPGDPHEAIASENQESAELFDLSSLPSLDQITAETDVRPFMNALVPEGLRNAALRRMWELDTAIRDYVSPATEYAWNWNEPGNAPGYRPLEAGYKALEVAEKMFSRKIDDESLVAYSGQATGNSGTAVASELPACDVTFTPQSGEAEALVEIETVRLSTKNAEDSKVTGDSPEEAAGAGPDMAKPLSAKTFIAPQPSAARHGKATPR